ncbi:Type II toxin-antitoxin system PemK/MazF family toxin [Candidatus Megaera venefica]|uniref:Type II toxin-antitoxin system PemK/MazF family toxin n=1 Tax=Candidatus Megaera venefica TaxID=2055910 RepID=A0ABU5NF47_9RICK|nr:type II toxin-antitoxin system PemK/MazF family toxin [Candidatus Megaera venefica]MEA0971770.1 Type II toxin-antitoxin system PemK/MazF family toxin [Candidatus Megaera venefica]
MVEQEKILTRGGIYLARLDPAKGEEIGKIRPIIILNSQVILNQIPPIIFICPLSSQSQPEFKHLHVELEVRDNLKVTSYALVEHCRSITINRVIHPRLAQTTSTELNSILHKLRRLVDF